MNNISRSLIIAGSGNQTLPPPANRWKPFFQSTDPRTVIGVGFNGYYPRDVYRNSFGGLSLADELGQAAPYLTEDDYVNYLKTIHPWVNVSNQDGAMNGTYYLDYVGHSLSNGSSYGGYDGYLLYQKAFSFNGINPTGVWTGTLQAYVYYKLTPNT